MESTDKEKPTVDMDKLDYSKFEESVDDVRSPGFIEEVRVITDNEISFMNTSPEELAKYLEKGYIIKLRRSFRDELPLFALLVLVLGLEIWFFNSWSSDLGEMAFKSQYFIPLALIAVILHRHFNSTYFINRSGITIVKGILTFYFLRFPLEYEKMRAIEVGKNILQRFLNVGDLIISTQLVGQPEIVIRGISNPYFYGTLLRTFLSKFDPQGYEVEQTFNRDD